MQGQESLGISESVPVTGGQGRRLVQTSKSWIHTDRRLLVAFRLRNKLAHGQILRDALPRGVSSSTDSARRKPRNAGADFDVVSSRP